MSHLSLPGFAMLSYAHTLSLPHLYIFVFFFLAIGGGTLAVLSTFMTEKEAK